MAVKKSSAEKRHKQSEERRMRNKAAKSQLHTYARKFVEACQKKDKEDATARLKTLVKDLDTEAGKGVISKNAAGRKKSRMMKLYNSTFAAAN